MLLHPNLVRDSSLQDTPWPQILAGFIHVAMKCCSLDLDVGHFKWESYNGHATRSPVIINNVHKFSGAGVQSVGWIHKTLNQLKGNIKVNRQAYAVRGYQ